MTCRTGGNLPFRCNRGTASTEVGSIETHNSRGRARVKAIVCTAYGPPAVLRLKEVDPPRLRNNGVCIRISATAVTASDCLVRGLKFRGWRQLIFRAAFGVRAPRAIIGMIASGEVESVGRDVTAFRPGDQGVRHGWLSRRHIRGEGLPSQSRSAEDRRDTISRLRLEDFNFSLSTCWRGIEPDWRVTDLL